MLAELLYFNWKVKTNMCRSIDKNINQEKRRQPRVRIWTHEASREVLHSNLKSVRGPVATNSFRCLCWNCCSSSLSSGRSSQSRCFAYDSIWDAVPLRLQGCNQAGVRDSLEASLSHSWKLLQMCRSWHKVCSQSIDHRTKAFDVSEIRQSLWSPYAAFLRGFNAWLNFLCQEWSPTRQKFRPKYHQPCILFSTRGTCACEYIINIVWTR